MRVDYHTHHYRCGHATGTLPEYVEAAIACNLDEIGLSDHSPYYHVPGKPHVLPRIAMAQGEFPNYLREAAELRDRYADRITVRVGVESDYVDGMGSFYRDLWRKYPVDYVIGSVHLLTPPFYDPTLGKADLDDPWVLTGWSIFDPDLTPGRSPHEVYGEYLRLTRDAARSGAYDIIGHLDALKTFGHMPDLAITSELEETVRTIAKADMAVELNTSGWRKKRCGDCYPRHALLELCFRHRVPIVLGSDAHAPDQVGADFDRAVALLRQVGYTEIATFQRRHRKMVPLT